MFCEASRVGHNTGMGPGDGRGMRSLSTWGVGILGLVCVAGMTACESDPGPLSGLGDTCSAASDCDPGLICQEGICVQLCSSDADCGMGEVCRYRTCEDAVCGNGVIELNEACDNGTANSNSGGCLSDCTIAACGDGFLYAGQEPCDDGNQTDGDGCDSNCTETACGNGIVTDGEECDDGNIIDNDGCESDCMTTICPPSMADGTPCGDDGLFCNGPEVCQNGLCLSEGSPCTEDDLACTTQLCDETTQACNLLDSGYCLIDGTCHEHLVRDPENTCHFCDSELDPGTWQVLGDGLTYDGGPNAADAGTEVGDACGTGVCADGEVICHPELTNALVCSTASLATVESCNRSDDNCNGLVDEGYWGDTSNAGEDYPDDYESASEVNYAYPELTMGDLQGKILPAGDIDIIRIHATEAETGWFDCVANDKPFRAELTLSAPDVTEFAAVYISLCWSDGDPSCLDTPEEFGWVFEGETIDIVSEKPGSCGTLDTATLEIKLEPYSFVDYSCDNWQLSWSISE